MLIDYNKFEIIPMGGYQIDHASNIKLLDTLEEFYHVSQTGNLNYYLSGSVCLSLLTNKVYRTWKDIDILIDEDTMVPWLDLFPKDKWFYFVFNKKITKVYNKKNSNYLELNTGDKETRLYYEKYLKITNYNGIKIGNLDTITFWKNNIRKNKKNIDLYDQIIIKQHLNLTRKAINVKIVD
jgi:hypothetical protein